MNSTPARINRFLREPRREMVYETELEDDFSDYEDPPPPYIADENSGRLIHFGVDPYNPNRFVISGNVVEYDQRDQLVLHVLLDFAAYLKEDGFSGRVTGLVLLRPHGDFEIVVHTMAKRHNPDGRLTFA